MTVTTTTGDRTMTTTSAWADRSEQIDAISAALVQALGEMADLPKTQTANTGKYAYSYATLGDALAQARPILRAHGLAITQTATTDGDDVFVFTTLLHTSGQYLTSQPIAMPIGQTAQATGSSITYGRRYSLMAVLGLATEDDDGASASHREGRRSRPAEPTPAVAEARTPEEAEIRRLMATLTSSERADLRAAFVETFGSNLSELEVSMHASALIWTQAACEAE